MQTLKKAEALIFQRMHTFQKGNMQSQFAFIASQVAKLIFKDTFIITIFIFPLETVHSAASLFFQLTARLNLAITIMLALFIVAFAFLGISKIACLEQKSKSFIQVLMPWIDIFSILILAVSFQLLLINLKDNLILIPFNVATIVSVSLIQIFYNLFNFTKEPRSSNFFKKREAPVISLCNIFTLFFCYYLSISYFSQHAISKQKAIVYSLIQFLLSLATIKYRVFMQYYLSPFSQNVSSLFYFLELNTGLLVLLFYLLDLDIISTNLVFLLIIMTLLEYSALNAYVSRRNKNMFLSSAAELKSEDDAILYLDRLCELITKVENEEESIILISLKKKHMITCKDAGCSCRTNEFQLGYFIKQYVRCEIQQICDTFHNSISILISTLYFKMVIFKYYPEILAKLNYYSSHLNLSLIQRYYKYCLAQYVAAFIDKKNYEISAVDSENMFKLEEIRVEIENITKSEIEIRTKQWKYLSRGLCRISELEHNCNLSLKNIARLMEIFEQNKVRFKKSKEFNLLLLFYFLKVSFLNNGKEIKENLKELYFGYKEDELYSLKEFKKFIYHKRSCVIETLVDTKTMGIITAASRNVEDMFGFPTNKIIGISINNLMPQFMAEEHEDIMAGWAKSGTWRTIGKLKEIYCVHKEQFCFSALIYLKIYIKDNNMHFITNIFKLNDTDYLIVNPNMKIEGIGRKFLKILGEPAKRINMELLIEQCGPFFSKKTFTEGKVYRKIFLSLKGLQSEVDLYSQEINMRFDESSRKEVNEGFHERLLSICQQKYCVQFTIKQYNMGKMSFFVICMKEAKKVERHQTANYIDKTQMYLTNENSKQLLDFDVADSDDKDFEKEEDNDQLIIEHNASSSLTSMNEKENYPIAKTIEKFIVFVQHPSSISDGRLSTFNIMMLTILMLLSVINFVSFYCYKQMLLEIEGIFFADGAQSDIMQTTEISYSYTYILKSQLLNASNEEFASTLQSARLVNNYVYSLREDSFARLVTNVTELSKDRLYAYLQQPTFWIMNKREVKVLTHQFLQNIHYLSARLFNEFERMKALNQTDVNKTLLYQLFNNFPQMQRLNQFFLRDYENISQRQHLMLSYFTIMSMVVYFLLSLVLSLTMNTYFKFRFNQLINSFTFLSYIPTHYLDKMKDYYALLINKIVEHDKLKTIDLHEDEIFEIDTYDLFHRNDPNKSNSTKIRFINYENYYKWIFILLIFCLLNALNYVATSQIRDFFPSSETVIREVNDLMRSENRLLQNYFDLRAAYSLDPNNYINQTLYNKLIVTLNQTETKFNSVANKLTTIFSTYNPTYQQTFVDTLVNNVCKLSAEFLTPFENNKCLKEMTLNILDGGILISMNFFQRNVRTALEDLKMQYITNNATKYQGDYFRQLDFVELDKMLIYMFKIYQLTQAVTYNSYIAVIQTITTTYLQLTIGMTAFFIAVMLVWVKSINAQKKSLSYLYGHLLLIPFMILKSNTRISSSLKEAVEYLDG